MNQVDYDPNPLSREECAAMSPGNEVFFIDPRSKLYKGSDSDMDEELLRRLDYTIVHVKRVVKFGGVCHGFEIDEYPNSGLVYKCFHRITGPSSIQEEDFNAVFV